MDPKLAELYGTNQPMEDVEKLAAAELAENLAGEGGIDFSNLDPEEVEALAREVLEAQSGEEGAPVGDEQEKVAEADYLGRVMAHSYNQEMRKIAADEAKTSFKEKMKGGFHKMKGKAQAAGGYMKGKATAAGGAAKAHVGRHPKKYMGAAGLGLAGAGFAAGRKSKKSSAEEQSALDTLATQRALEILEANGIDPNEQEKTSGAEPAEVLTAAVEARALEILAENGYVETEE